MTPTHSIWVKLDRFPPVLVRLLATEGAQVLSDDTIVTRSGLPLAEVKRLSYMRSWDDVPVGTMRRFCRACGVDFADARRMKVLTRYLSRRPKWVHLRRHPSYPEFRRMLAQLL